MNEKQIFVYLSSLHKPKISFSIKFTGFTIN